MTTNNLADNDLRALFSESPVPKIGDQTITDWLTIDSEHLQAFAQATYLEPELVDLSSSISNYLGHDLVDGFLLLSLVVHFGFREPIAPLLGWYGYNYGTDRVRFTSPVFAGERVRLERTLVAVKEKTPPHFLVTTDNTLQVERADGTIETAMVARYLTLFVPGESTVQP